MTEFAISVAQAEDRPEIKNLVERAFGQPDEARLVDALAEAGDTVLELIGRVEGRIVAHVLFSRLWIDEGDRRQRAVALAPLAVDPDHQRKKGYGASIVEEGHRRLRSSGETLSVVLGDPAYYGRFGYEHMRARDFTSDYQCDALQALAWGDAPSTGQLIYAAAFSGL